MSETTCLTPGPLRDALGQAVHDPDTCRACNPPPPDLRSVVVLHPPDGGAPITLGITRGSGYIAADVVRGVFAASPGMLRRRQ